MPRKRVKPKSGRAGTEREVEAALKRLERDLRASKDDPGPDISDSLPEYVPLTKGRTVAVVRPKSKRR
jgi:hypothetical protein